MLCRMEQVTLYTNISWAYQQNMQSRYQGCWYFTIIWFFLAWLPKLIAIGGLKKKSERFLWKTSGMNPLVSSVLPAAPVRIFCICQILISDCSICREDGSESCSDPWCPVCTYLCCWEFKWMKLPRNCVYFSCNLSSLFALQVLFHV